MKHYLLVAIVMLCCISTYSAQTTKILSQSGKWSKDSNWTPNGVPDPALDDIIIPAGLQVTHDYGDLILQGTGSLTVEGALRMKQNGMDVKGGTSVVVNGIIEDLSSLNLVDASSSFINNGVVGMKQDQSIEVGSGCNLTINAGASINQVGSIDVAGSAVVDGAVSFNGNPREINVAASGSLEMGQTGTLNSIDVIYLDGIATLGGAVNMNGGTRNIQMGENSQLTVDGTINSLNDLTVNGAVNINGAINMNGSGNILVNPDYALNVGASAVIENFSQLTVEGSASFDAGLSMSGQQNIDVKNTGNLVFSENAPVSLAYLNVEGNATFGCEVTMNGQQRIEVKNTGNLVVGENAPINNLAYLTVEGETTISSGITMSGQQKIEVKNTGNLVVGENAPINNLALLTVEGMTNIGSSITMSGQQKIEVKNTGDLVIGENAPITNLALLTVEGMTNIGSSITMSGQQKIEVKNNGHLNLTESAPVTNLAHLQVENGVATIASDLTMTGQQEITVNSNGELVLDANSNVNNVRRIYVEGMMDVHGEIAMNGWSEVMIQGGDFEVSEAGIIAVINNFILNNGSFLLEGVITVDNQFNNTGNITGTGEVISSDEDTSNWNLGNIEHTVCYPGNTVLEGCTASAALPIDLIFFEVRTIDRGVELTWKTGSETNNDFFTIERSLDGGTWSEVSTMSGAGNSSTVLEYKTIDFDPPAGVLYYRLKQTDFDGSYDYSKVKSVEIKSGKDVLVYPNPTADVITITGISTETSTFFIFDTSGQDVTGLTTSFNISDAKVSIDLSQLGSGMYFIKTESFTQAVYRQ